MSTSVFYFPKSICDAIESAPLTKLNRDNAYNVVDTIMYKTLLQAYCDPVTPLCADVLIKNYGSRYFTGFFSWLKENNIIQAVTIDKLDKNGGWVEPYTVGEISKQYYIPHEHLGGDVVAVRIKDRPFHAERKRVMVGTKNFYDNKRELMSSLFYAEEKLIAAKDVAVAKVKPEDFKIDNEITKPRFEVYDKLTSCKWFSSLERSIELAHKQGLVLIQDDNKIYRDTLDNYITNKKQHIEHSYTIAIEKLLRGDFYIMMAQTNGRIHHNLTEAASVITDVIKESNGLRELDLNNSQFALQAHLMKKSNVGSTHDYEIFKQVTADGTFYEYLADKFDIKRKQMKSLMMSIAFSKDRYVSPEKKKFAEVFPTVAKFMSDYKKVHGDNQLAIKLQRMESDFFIQRLYPKLYKKYGMVLTKHDSFLIQEEKYDEVAADFAEDAAKINFKCSFKK